MRFGVCSSLDRVADVKAAGFDFIEASVQELLQGTAEDAAWTGEALAARSPLPILTAYLLVPASMKIVGPEADLSRLTRYMERIVARAGKLGIGVLGFGSGGARQVPDGFERGRAMEQLIGFCRVAGDLAAAAGVTVAMEPLNRAECNLVNTIAEVAAVVRSADRPAFRALLDAYHLWLENEPLEHVAEAVDLFVHVHVADAQGRTPPGESGKSDYHPIFRLLKQVGYDGMMSVEAKAFDAESGARSLEFLKRQWKES